MKILILGHFEIASNYAISLIVNRLGGHDLSIMLSGKGDLFEEGGNEFSKLARYEQSLCDDLNLGKDTLELGCDGFDVLSEKTGKSIEIISSPNSKQGIATLKQLEPELIISIRYRKIFKEKIIEIPKYGIINLHSGLLPQYRGAMATFWAMLNQDELIGSTLHYISDASIDTGEIIAKSSIPCDYSSSYLSNVLNLYPKGCTEILRAVDEIATSGRAKAQDQKSLGDYYSFPALSDLDQFQRLGFYLY